MSEKKEKVQAVEDSLKEIAGYNDDKGVELFEEGYDDFQLVEKL